MYFICRVTSQNFNEGSCEFKGGSSSWYAITLKSLVSTGSVIVEMFLIYPVTTRLKVFVNL